MSDICLGPFVLLIVSDCPVVRRSRARKLRRPYGLIGAGYAASPFSFPRGNGAPGGARGLRDPFGEALRSAPPRALRERAHPCEGCCASQRSIAALTSDSRRRLSSGPRLS